VNQAAETEEYHSAVDVADAPEVVEADVLSTTEVAAPVDVSAVTRSSSSAPGDALRVTRSSSVRTPLR
jgi:hypothetical protein